MDNQNDTTNPITETEEKLSDTQPVTVESPDAEMPVSTDTTDTQSDTDDTESPEETTTTEESEDDTQEERMSDGGGRAMSRLELESMITRYLDEQEKLRNQIKSQKEMYDAAFENDAEYTDKADQADTLKKEVSGIKQRITKDPSVQEIEKRMKELKEEVKDVQDAISRFAELYVEVAGTNQLMREDGEVLQIIKNYKLIKQKKE